ncbi:energy transducer TonB [Williamwhitmania taraxaci]|uniref:Protein TonB n=1 Tax=Williamwhitmania taraxaci TaxID=1640674 RepID=A0A1G6KXF9_9BACT|nr:energy transducer TonB [Williamwhitmania taraxaci]SDC35155.1 protein TonB [Williamwhitmania taraxaci]
MESKKSTRANLETKKGMFFQFGLLVTIAASLAAFEWSSQPDFKSVEYTGNSKIDIDLIDIPITVMANTKTPPLPHVNTEIVIVTNEKEIQDDKLDLWDGEDTKIDISKLPYWSEPKPEKPVDEDIIIYVPSEFPKFRNGGTETFMAWVFENLKYPDIAIEEHMEGTVYIGFVVNKEGYMENVTIKRGVDPILDKEALRVIKSCREHWTPGLQGTRTVKVGFTIPIKFKLNN